MLKAVKDQTNLIPFPTTGEFTCDEDVIGSWLEEKSLSTASVYQNVIAQCLDWLETDLRGLNFTSLQRYRSLLQEEYKVKTARKKLSAVRSLLAFACDIEYISHNPATKLRNIKP